MHSRQTEVLKVHPTQPEQASIERAASLIRAGDMVVFPTETVYGLGADALQPAALERIFAAKGRPFTDPLIVHIADHAALTTLISEVPSVAWQLAEAFWPGPLTLIMPASSRVPGLVTAGLPTVAIRMPRHTIALELIRAVGSPIAAPSANRFMHVSPTIAQHALADLQGRVPLILDGGPCMVGVKSTVLDLCAPEPRILRPGGVSLEALRRVIPAVQYAQPQAQSEQQNEAQAAPGQMLVHYAPTVPTVLFAGSPEAMRQAMLAAVQRYRADGEQVGVLVADEDVATFTQSGAQVYALGTTPEQIATRLFAGLRALEDAGVQAILCRSFAEQGLGRAIHDRLLKAAGGQVFKCS